MIKINKLAGRWQSFIIGTVGLIGVLVTGGNEAIFAQVIPDDTLGAESSVVTPDVLIREILSDRIDGGATRGANLFHSFLEFNIGEGRGVYFANPDGIENILSRVTGDNVSTILGRLGVLGEANLFLLNPNGILFGENASLDIEGSFVATTASGIELGEDGVFSVTQPKSSRLLSVSPGALFYNAVEAAGGKITNRGNLTVGQRESLTLAGDTVTSTGSLAAPGGTVQVLGERVGLLENARIDVSSDTGGGTVLIGGAFQGQGTIPNAARTFVGKEVIINANALTRGHGGNVIVWADEVTGFYGNISARGGSEAGNGGFVEVSGKEHLIFRGTVDTTAVNGLWGTLLLDPTDIVIANGSGDSGADGTDTFAGNNSGVAGAIFSAPLSEIDDATPTTIYESELEGLAGDTNVILQATNNITVNDLTDDTLSFAAGSGLIGFTADADGDGVGSFLMQDVADTLSTNGRDIVISGASLTLGNINTFGLESGSIKLRATNGSISVVNLNTNNPVNAGGAISLDASDSITTGIINSSSSVNGGAISARAGGDITTNGDLNSYSYSESGNVGNGGTITLESDSGDIITNTLLNSYSSSPSGNAGNGGAISARAGGDITTNGDLNSYSYSKSGNAGNGGTITLESDSGDIITNKLLYSYSSSESGDTGNGGTITLDSDSGNITTNELLYSFSYSSSGDAGNGGAISLASDSGNITTNKLLYSYSRSFSGNAGNGGAISLFSDSGNITTNGDLNSYSYSELGDGGNGGTITLDSDSGNITTNNVLFSFSYSPSGNARNGGAISLIARDGYIRGGSSNLLLSSFAISETGNAGSGGKVTVAAQSNITNLEILTLSSSDEAGDVEINGLGDLSMTNTQILTSRRVEAQVPRLDPIIGEAVVEIIILEVGGKGQSGDVTVTSSGNLTFNNSSIESDTNGSDNAGNVMITSPGLVRFNNSQIISNTSNIGKAGDIEINAGGGITFQGLYSGEGEPQGGLFAGTTNEGFAGNITLTTPELTLQNAANIDTITASSGAAGNITLQSHPNGENLTINLAQGTSISASTNSNFNQATGGDIEIKTPDSITIQGQGTITTETAGAGNAGNIKITSTNLDIQQTTLSASTSSPNPSGVGGNLTINATESFNLTNQASLLAQSTGAAKAGNVTINTEQLTADNGSITTSARATSLGEGGSIDVNASQINLKGTEIGLLAETEGVAPAGALTLQPFANGQDLTINLQDNAKISAATSGSGEGGSLSVTAPESITIRGQGQLSVETTGDGAAGNLTIDTQNLTITDSATISASTASANPQGLGGNLTINATESFTLTNQARILAQSTGAAPAGTITVDTGQLTANNGSIETSATQSAGGAITITASDIRLFGDSDIRTDVASGVGGGGNITLTADTILAFADSDILAFAQDGKGGDITFNTPVFFGFAYAPAPKGTDPDTLDHNGRVDINATGAVEGVITLPDTSAVRNSLTPLSNNQIDTDKLIAESCIARRHEPKRGSFFITGTGGIPFRPGDLYVTPYQTGTVRSIPSERDGEAGEESSSTRRPWKIGDPIIEPTGIYRLANGELIMGRLCGE